MPLLQDQDREFLIEKFADLKDPINLIVFTQEDDCQYCPETSELAGELAELSDKINLETYDYPSNMELAAEYNIDKIPATVVMRGGDAVKDYGIRYYGIPSGYEFSSYIEAISMVGMGESGLSDETKAWVATLETPIEMQVFVTPTCPHCPRAVVLAHQLAMESDLITGHMVEAIEFPELSTKYQVQGVPRTVINENIHMEGAAPESMILDKLKQAAAA